MQSADPLIRRIQQKHRPSKPTLGAGYLHLHLTLGGGSQKRGRHDCHHMQAAPIVRVAVEAKAPGDMGALAAGLDLLHRADPLAEVTLQPSGEHVLGAAGECVVV